MTDSTDRQSAQQSDRQPDTASSQPAPGRHHVSVVDKRPYFEKTLAFAVRQKIVDRAGCERIVTDGAKGTLQVADFFGSSHLYLDLENAHKRIVNLVSLYLEDRYEDDLRQAAQSLRDNTFLSHSRGGNEMLKALFALPDSTVFGDVKSQTVKEFQDEHTLAQPYTLAAYRKQLKLRRQSAALLDAAQWLADSAGLDHDELAFVGAESVIRSAVLMRAAGSDAFPGRASFARLVDGVRGKAQAAGKLKIPAALLNDLPPAYRIVADKIRRNIEKNDAALLLDGQRSLGQLLNDLQTRYFTLESGLDDVGEFDAFVSREWFDVTKGKEDPYSRLTVFLCIAAGMPPKTALTMAEAKNIVKRVREHGFDSVAVASFIRDAAPFEIKDDLVALWEEEFLPDAELSLLDGDDLQFSLALSFLKDNCNIKAPRNPAGAKNPAPSRGE